MDDYQRASRRYSLDSVDAVVAGVVCQVVNVSAEGILIEGWENPPPMGTTGVFTVRAPLAGQVLSIEITGTVIRLQDNGAVALTYQMPRQDWSKILLLLDKQQKEGKGAGEDEES